MPKLILKVLARKKAKILLNLVPRSSNSLHRGRMRLATRTNSSSFHHSNNKINRNSSSSRLSNSFSKKWTISN